MIVPNAFFTTISNVKLFTTLLFYQACTPQEAWGLAQ